MGWIANEPGESEQSTVEDLVNDLNKYLDSRSGLCQGYSGQAKKCCNDLYSCFVTLKAALLNIKATHEDRPNMDVACSQVQHQLNKATGCVEEQNSHCHVSLSRSSITSPFYETISSLTASFVKHCIKTSSTVTPTTTTSTISSSVSSTTSPSFTTPPTLTTSGRDIHSTTQGADIIDADNDLLRTNNTTSLPEENFTTTIIITSSSIGVLLVIVAIVIAVFCYRKRNPGPYCSDDSASSKKSFVWRWLHTSKPDENQCADSEIYTEIDEAFMDAVYQLSRETPSNSRDKIHHTAQINVCYGTGLNDDDIILSKPEPTSAHVPPEILEYENPNPLNPLDLIRKNDDTVTSFNSTTSPVHVRAAPRTSGYENVSKRIGSNAVLVLPNQKRYINSRPGFTAVTQTTSGGYVQIEAMENVDRIYAEPTDVDSVYDTTSKFDLHRKVVSKNENVYNSLHTYDSTLISNRKQNVKQNSSESAVNQNKPNYLYENPCLEY